MLSEEEEDGQRHHYQTELDQLEAGPRPGFRRCSLTWRAISKDFTHLRRAGEFSDAIIKVGSVSFPVHRNILACCSPYFRALFTDLARNGKSGNVNCSDNHAMPSAEVEGTSPVLLDPDGGEAMDFMQTNRDVSWFTRSSSSTSKPGCQEELPTHSLAHANCGSVSPCSPSHLTQLPSASGSACSFSLHRRNMSSSSLDSKNDLSPASSCNTRTRTSPVRLSSILYPSKRLGTPCYEVTIPDVSPDTMNDIIEYAYGGKVNVSAHNVEQLLPAADRFQVMSLLHECCEFLAAELSITNCISIVKFASHFFQCDALRERGTKFLLDNFPAVFQNSAEFEKLTCLELSAILKADQLNVKHEELVLDAIIRWVIANVEERQRYIPELVSCARVGLMSPDNMREFVDSWLLCSNLSSNFNKVTLKVMESVLQMQKQQMAEVDGAMFSPRLPRDILFVVGGSNFGFPLNLVEAFDCRTWMWSIICPYEFAPRSYHGMVALDSEIYIIGGFSGQVYLSSCCKLKPATLTWEDVTPMNTKRCYVGCAELKGAIYAVGGYDGVYRLNSAERFNKDSNQWSFIAPMTQQRSDAGVAVLDDKLFVCGGFNGVECIRAVEMYEPETDCWSSIPSMPRGRSGLGVVAYNGCLYAVGGFDGTDSSVRLATVESYSPETRQWTRLEPMPHPRSNLAVEVVEDVLYAIGGYSGDRTTSVVECYNFASNSWYPSTRLSHNRSALGVCVISGLSNTADILRRDRRDFRQTVLPAQGGFLTESV